MVEAEDSYLAFIIMLRLGLGLRLRLGLGLGLRLGLTRTLTAAAHLERARERVGCRREASGEAVAGRQAQALAHAAPALARVELLEPCALQGRGLGSRLGSGLG